MTTSPAVLAQTRFEEEPINYRTAPVDDPIARLQKRLDIGDTRLDHDEQWGYLPSVLEELDVPISSQVLVFSKTSLQRHHISPENPRAIYFNDDVYVGWVRGGDVVEISSVDPELGAVFYLLKQQESDRPTFLRQTDRCTLCHGSSHTQGVPGHLVRSVYPARDGMPVFSAGTFRTDHTSPFKERWGGWYVTGKHGKLRHMGNVLVPNIDQAEAMDMEAGANLTDLGKRFPAKAYLAPSSDLVSLMVLEHQSQMHNFITRANYDARFALRDEQVINEALDRPEDYRSESTERRFASAGERLLKYMLFKDEFLLTSPVEGNTDYAKQFAARGPRDRRGRSLRDFDLNRRMFKYPCSYLIYSESFDRLPSPVKEYVYRRLWEVLRGEDTGEDYAHLSPADRRAVFEILADTKSDLPSYWK